MKENFSPSTLHTKEQRPIESTDWWSLTDLCVSLKCSSSLLVRNFDKSSWVFFLYISVIFSRKLGISSRKPPQWWHCLHVKHFLSGLRNSLKDHVRDSTYGRIIGWLRSDYVKLCIQYPHVRKIVIPFKKSMSIVDRKDSRKCWKSPVNAVILITILWKKACLTAASAEFNLKSTK